MKPERSKPTDILQSSIREAFTASADDTQQRKRETMSQQNEKAGPRGKGTTRQPAQMKPEQSKPTDTLQSSIREAFTASADDTRQRKRETRSQQDLGRMRKNDGKKCSIFQGSETRTERQGNNKATRPKET